MSNIFKNQSNLHKTIGLLFLMASSHAMADNQQVISDDGREVLLKEDGSWIFISNDRFANTTDGRRVKLKDDGSWEYIGDAVTKNVNKPMQQPLLNITIEKAVIEKYQKQMLKNIRISTQTVFYLKLELSPQAKNRISLSEEDIASIKITDNKGNDYPVLSITPNPMTLAPSAEATLSLRADNSPSWWKQAKKVDIVFKPGILGIQKAITLTQDVNDFEEIRVDGFEETE